MNPAQQLAPEGMDEVPVECLDETPLTSERSAVSSQFKFQSMTNTLWMPCTSIMTSLVTHFGCIERLSYGFWEYSFI
jgi:hypothetical protein